ncbi:MAG: ABC transporter substrate-binding protein [Chloroflexi bacterium]|nr:ABC transporter substrate-binding protein [Chloroflexota bacterium]
MRRASVLLVSVALLLALLLAACGKEEKATPAAAPTKAAAATPAATQAPAATPTPVSTAGTIREFAKTFARVDSPDLKKWPAEFQDIFKKYSPDSKKSPDPYKPYYGGTVVYASGPPVSFNHVKSVDVSRYFFTSIMQGKLVRPRLNWGDDGLIDVPEPDLAEKWTVSDDGTKWTFNLRKGVKWHNIAPVNGREVKCSDTKFVFDIWRTESVLKAEFTEIQDVSCVDDYTLVIKSSIPMFDLVSALMSPKLLFFSPECWKEEKCMDTKPIGWGPYMLEKYEAGVQYVLAKNADYYGTDDRCKPTPCKLPYMDKIQGITIADPSQLLAGFRTQKIDHYTPYTYTELETILPTLGFTPLVEMEVPCIEWNLCGVLFQSNYRNVDDPWVKDVRVRQALSMAIDRPTLDKTAFGKTASGVLPVIPFYQMGMDFPPRPEELHANLQFNPTKAKQLLEEAGYGKGFKIKLTVTAATVSRSLVFQNAYDAIKKMWKDNLNVDLEYDFVQGPTLNAALQKGEWDDLIQITTWQSGSRNYMAGFNRGHSKGAANFAGYKDPQMDDWLEKMQKLPTDSAERKELGKKVWQRFQEQVYVIMGGDAYWFNLWQPYVINTLVGRGDHNMWFGFDNQIKTWLDPNVKGIPSERAPKKS